MVVWVKHRPQQWGLWTARETGEGCPALRVRARPHPFGTRRQEAAGRSPGMSLATLAVAQALLT